MMVVDSRVIPQRYLLPQLVHLHQYSHLRLHLELRLQQPLMISRALSIPLMTIQTSLNPTKMPFQPINLAMTASQTLILILIPIPILIPSLITMETHRRC